MNLKTIAEKSAELAKDFIKYNNKGISPYHVVKHTGERLTAKGKPANSIKEKRSIS